MSKLTILGFGRLGGAIARGALRAGALRADDIVAVDTLQARLDEARVLGIRTANINAKLGETTLLIALKPQTFDSLTLCENWMSNNTPVISVMAGWSSAAIARKLDVPRVIRAMPTVAAIVAASTTALCIPHDTPTEQAEFARALFAAIGRVIEIDESHFDVATACGASAVAYACLFIETLEHAAISMGLDQHAARAFAMSSVEGAVAAWHQAKLTPKQLRENVISPGGTTAVALKVLSDGGFETLVERAAIAARDRARELGTN